MEKKKYYINLASHEISQIRYDNNDSYTIYATDDDVRMLRAKMDNMGDASIRNFFRAHVPIMPYHLDQSNDDYDDQLTEAYQLIYHLGDDDTKQHIDQIGILDEKKF